MSQLTSANVWACVATGMAGLCVGLLLRGRKNNSPASDAAPELDATIFTDAEPTVQPGCSVAAPSDAKSPGSSGEFLQFMLGVVDAIDEIDLMKVATPAESTALCLIQERLRDLIELSGGELIRETSWQPEVQRAVKVEPAESGQSEIRYLQSRSTGLKHADRIIRKQEVTVSQPSP